MKTIAVLFGGCSPEYSVSLKSAHAVLTHIDQEKYRVIAVGITRDGRWLRYLGDYDLIPSDRWHEDPSQCRSAFLSPDRSVRGLCEITGKGLSFISLDGVFPVLHGRNGEDGTVQGLAQMAGIPIIGCDAMSSALSMDKYRAHLIAEAAGIKVPKAVHFFCRPDNKELTEATADLQYPLYVKPLRAGSSFGISKIDSPDQLPDAVTLALDYDNEIIIEENIEGFEVGCSVLGTCQLTLGRVDELEVPGGFFDYTEKYTQKKAHIHMPARIDSDTEKRIQAAAERIYRALGCSGFARVDMFLTPEGEIVFNEVNTIPGFTALSRYPKMLQGVGLSYEETIERLISETLC